MSRHSGKTVIVTGASSGIGRGIALLLADEGAFVAVLDQREEPIEGGEPTCAVIAARGGEAAYWNADIASWEDIDAAFGQIVENRGRIDILVNNAATYASKPITETTISEWDKVIAVNLTGMFFCCKRAIRQMLKQDPVNDVRGRIINITSQHGMICAPNDFAYGVSKAGGVYMTRQIAVDYAKDLIVVNAVAPGKIVTGKPGIAADPAKLAYARARTPMPRFGEPADVARTVSFLASEECTFMTGENVLVDGGWMAG